MPKMSLFPKKVECSFNLFDMFPHCCCSAMAWRRCCLGGLAKGWWAVLGMVTEGGDLVVLTSQFYGSHKGS